MGFSIWQNGPYFIQVVVFIISFSLFYYGLELLVHMYKGLLSLDEHFGCLQCGITKNKAPMNICVHIVVQTYISIILG